MPYIDKKKRTEFEGIWYFLNADMNAGELNYVITKIILKYLGSNPNYQRYNDVMGVLSGADKELYRRMTSKYEDKKKKINGDVY